MELTPENTQIPWEGSLDQAPNHDLFVAIVDALCGQACRNNPGVPHYVYQDEDFKFTYTDDYQLAMDFSLRHPFYIVVFDRVMGVFHLRVAI